MMFFLWVKRVWFVRDNACLFKEWIHERKSGQLRSNNDSDTFHTICQT